MNPRGKLPAATILAAFLAAGCGSSKLETGYTPRPLNASDTERRAYYSGKYTKESVKAEQEREAEFRGPPAWNLTNLTLYAHSTARRGSDAKWTFVDVLR